MTTPYNNVLYDIDEAIVTIEDNDCNHNYNTCIFLYIILI